MPAPIEIRAVTVDPVTWTAVVVPFDCSSINLKNGDAGNGLRIRTDAANAATQDSLGPGIQQSIALPFHRYRFPQGSTPLYLQSTAGAGPAIVTFLV